MKTVSICLEVNKSGGIFVLVIRVQHLAKNSHKAYLRYFLANFWA